jgi:hypothetical protein
MTEEEMRTWLSGFYAHAAKGFEMQLLQADLEWHQNDAGPNAKSDPKVWRIKPLLKVIDLSPLVGTDILCSFGREPHMLDATVSRLSGVGSVGFSPETNNYDLNFTHCIPLMNHIHFWKGGKACPLPEGFEVRLHFRDYHPQEFNGGRYRWSHNRIDSDIIGIEFLKVKDDYTIGQGE